VTMTPQIIKPTTNQTILFKFIAVPPMFFVVRELLLLCYARTHPKTVHSFCRKRNLNTKLFIASQDSF
jgi:hypothetical protein